MDKEAVESTKKAGEIVKIVKANAKKWIKLKKQREDILRL